MVRDVDQPIDRQVRDDLAFLEGRVLGVLRFGSSLDPRAEARDIDLCLVAPGTDPSRLLLEVFGRLDVRGRRYDLHVFSELPIWLRYEVLRRHVVVSAPDLPALSEHLYHQRKFCDDMLHRQRNAG